MKLFYLYDTFWSTVIMKNKNLGNILVFTVALLFLAACASLLPKPLVTGDWVLTVDIGGQGGDVNFNFADDGDGNLSGTYAGQLGEANLTGTTDGESFEFFFQSGQVGTITYSGTMIKDSMEGKVVYGQIGEGTFTGKKSG